MQYACLVGTNVAAHQGAAFILCLLLCAVAVARKFYDLSYSRTRRCRSVECLAVPSRRAYDKVHTARLIPFAGRSLKDTASTQFRLSPCSRGLGAGPMNPGLHTRGMGPPMSQFW